MEKTACIRSDTVISDLTLNESTILAALKALEVGKATGPDEIPAKLLKQTASVTAPSLCRIFNKSLQLGSLPSDWKLANVVHVHKKDAKDHVENHRPISLLPIVSKVFFFKFTHGLVNVNYLKFANKVDALDLQPAILINA